MRRFAGRVKASLETEAMGAAASVERLLDAFQAKWRSPAPRKRLPEYSDQLREMVDRLDREQWRVEEIADELRLREHWAMIRRVRAMPGEEWQAESPEFRARYGVYRS